MAASHDLQLEITAMAAYVVSKNPGGIDMIGMMMTEIVAVGSHSWWLALHL